MNKDAILATAIGFGIGLCITGLVLLGPRLMGSLPKISLPSFGANSKTTPTPDAKKPVSGLTIDSPLPDAIESEAEVLVSGMADSGATVVIQGNINDAVTESSNDSKYAGKIALVEGKNDITVTAYLHTKQTTQTITVYYTPEEF